MHNRYEIALRLTGQSLFAQDALRHAGEIQWGVGCLGQALPCELHPLGQEFCKCKAKNVGSVAKQFVKC